MGDLDFGLSVAVLAVTAVVWIPVLVNEGADVVALLEAAADVCENVASCDPSDT